MFRWFSTWVLGLLGWQVQGSFKNLPPKFIVIVGPHTSNWDFVLGIMARSMLGLSKSKYLGKSQLFKFPYGFIFRALGGYPVDRTKYNNLVDASVAIFNEKEEFSVALAPEGTRAKVNRFKTGFYYIARKANIPVYMVGFDYATKQFIISKPFKVTKDILSDFEKIYAFFVPINGKKPELGIDELAFEEFAKSIEN